MNKAKKIYLDADGDMVKKCEKWDREHFPEKYTEVDVKDVTHLKNLTLIGWSWLNSGVTFWFKDEDGRRYPMTDTVFRNYLALHPINIGNVVIEYLQQGSVYSIGVVGCDTNN